MKKIPLFIKIILAILLVAVIAVSATLLVRYTYTQNLKPVSTSQQVQVITIPLGATVKDIAAILKENSLIRQPWAFEWYVRNSGLRDKLQAGTYAITPSQSVSEIAEILAHGEVATDLVTILPGNRLDQIRAALINSGFAPDAVDAALRPENYVNHPALVEKPENATLEGYLYPESFHKTAETVPEDIIRASLDEMQKRLTPTVRNGMAAQDLSVYEGIILASIIEQEVSSPEDRRMVAQVFLRRLREGMMLQSDPTAKYGAILAGQPPSLTYESAYNTYLHGGLPPSPISNVSESSLLAVINPASTDYLFFVSGDDGTTHFSRTLAEHEALTRQYCKQLCQ